MFDQLLDVLLLQQRTYVMGSGLDGLQVILHYFGYILKIESASIELFVPFELYYRILGLNWVFHFSDIIDLQTKLLFMHSYRQHLR